MRWTSFLFLLFYLLNVETYGQISTDGIVPPSPITQQFNKAVEFGPATFNGVPDIQIPLHSIDVKGLSFPVSLHYDASGIKFKQNNGEVGVGWSLMPGYRVSRTINSRPDEAYEMPNYIQDSLLFYANHESLLKQQFLSKFITYGSQGNYPLIPGFYNLESQFDWFYYQIPNKSGSFLISDRVNKKIAHISSSNVEVEYEFGGMGTGGIYEFIAKDDSGNTYYFGVDSEGDSSIFEQHPESFGYATAWALRQIVTLNNDTVTFNYNIGYTGGWERNTTTQTIVEGIPCIPNAASESSNSGSDASYQTFFNTEIITPNERILIEREFQNRVSKIEIFSKKNALIKGISFFYTDSVAGSSHTVLDSIHIVGRDLTTFECYRFDYYTQTISSSQIFVADQWDYYLLATNLGQLYHEEFQADTVFVSGFNRHSVNYFFGPFIKRDRSEDPFTPDYFSLKKISYPTGGTLEYQYENNLISGLNDGSAIGGGIRVKKLVAKDGLTGKTLVRTFKYGLNENGLGIPTVPRDYKQFVNETYRLIFEYRDFADYVHLQRHLNYSTKPFGDVDQSGFVSSHVVYPVVTEYFGSEQSDHGGGKIVYMFEIGSTFNTSGLNPPPFYQIGCAPDGKYYYNGPNYVHLYRTWHKPVLVEKLTYSNASAGYSLKQKQLYEYDNYLGPSFKGLKVHPIFSYDDFLWAGYEEYTEYLITGFFKYGSYEIETGERLLTKFSETFFEGLDSLTTIEYYGYNSKHQTSFKKLARGVEMITEEFTYPWEYANLIGNLDRDKAFLLLNEKNSIRQAVETRIYRSNVDGTEKRLLSARFLEYHPTRPLLVKEFLVKTNISLTNFLPSSVHNGSTAIDSRYILEQEIEKYDSRGNILTMLGRGNHRRSFLWDYNQSYLIATVENAGQDEVGYSSFEATGNGNWIYSGEIVHDVTAPMGTKVLKLSGEMVKSGLNSARSYTVGYWKKEGTVSVNSTIGVEGKEVNGWTYFEHTINNPINGTIILSGINCVIDEVKVYPISATINTYAYELNVGMTGHCDPNNNISYYSYDGFRRLALIRDQENKILKRICYNYAGQPEDCTIYYSQELNQNFTRNCGEGFIGSSVTYTVPAGRYSASSQALANQLAQNEIDANGQNLANQNGSCTVACQPSSCTLNGPAYKCVNGICEQGVKVYTGYEVVAAGKYTCFYHYLWSDGSWSPTYLETNAPFPCINP